MKAVYMLLFFLFFTVFTGMAVFCLLQEPLEIDYYLLLDNGFMMLTFAILWRTHGK